MSTSAAIVTQYAFEFGYGGSGPADLALNGAVALVALFRSDEWNQYVPTTPPPAPGHHDPSDRVALITPPPKPPLT